MPADFRLVETRQPPLKDQYDEWLARVICYAFSVPATPFVAQVNRATSETMRMQATQEGLLPLKTWIKSALDLVIQSCMGEPGLEFVWVGDDAIDPLQQAQTLQILVSAGIKTREEARAELGLESGEKAGAGLGKYNQNHDERGRFATAEDAVGVVGHPARRPRPQGVRVASNDAVMSDVGSPVVAQAVEGEEDEEPRPEENREDETVTYVNPDTGEMREYPVRLAPRKPEGWVDTRDLPDSTKPEFFEPLGGTPAGTVADAVAPGGVLPGEATNVGDTRSMPASADPNLSARAYVLKAYNGQNPLSLTPLGEEGGFVAELPDGAYITFRPAGQASRRTPAETASVDVNDATINELNGGAMLKLKFPKREGRK